MFGGSLVTISNEGQGTRLGLGLSGGGFRAAFYHIGVLAQLAECGLLRQVEVISSVSGGSIISAYYYLHLKHLLETVPQQEITDDMLLAMVNRMADSFFKQVEKNFYMLAYQSFRENRRMYQENYSRSDRMGELYDQLLYRPFLEEAYGKSWPGPVYMHQLKIQPLGQPESFHPLRDNDQLLVKVPILQINATMLNTGHNWRFEATRMGPELAAGTLATDVDKKDRYTRPTSYEELPDSYRNFELGIAVAASSCVPGLFHPLALRDLYPDSSIELVDGGVQDNQGVGGLLEMECTHMIISDASGQLNSEARPAKRVVAALERASGIMNERMRDEVLYHLFARMGQATENPLNESSIALLHLKKGLGIAVHSYRTREAVAVENQEQPSYPKDSTFQYGVDPRIQRKLAAIRTDLDSFTEVEGYSLMLNGYQVSKLETVSLQQQLCPHQPTTMKQPVFLQPGLAAQLSNPNETFLRLLDVACKTSFFKLPVLFPWLNALFASLGLILLILIVRGLYEVYQVAIHSAVGLWLNQALQQGLNDPWWFSVMGTLALLLAAWLAWKLNRIRHTFFRRFDAVGRVIFLIWSLVASMSATAYLRWLNPLFLSSGRLSDICPYTEDGPVGSPLAEIAVTKESEA
jgi:predicted acylesterase/phospholipase RssA